MSKNTMTKEQRTEYYRLYRKKKPDNIRLNSQLYYWRKKLLTIINLYGDEIESYTDKNIQDLPVIDLKRLVRKIEKKHN